MGSVKDIKAHLRHSRPDTTANEYMQQVPESVREIVGSMYLMLAKERGGKTSLEDLLPNATNNLLEQAVSH
jgi:hypothetical protein